jgi:cation diffusion facilitator CzcD-associated flavoprotein CzcO
VPTVPGTISLLARSGTVGRHRRPWYRQSCKRPTFNDEYLATFNRPNVELIDVSASKGVERITEHAVVANGVTYEVVAYIVDTVKKTRQDGG